MAYQNVGTPRFYISIFPWLNSLGLGYPAIYGGQNDTPSTGNHAFDLNPSSQLTWAAQPSVFHSFYVKNVPIGKLNFWAFLGHEVAGNPFNIIATSDGGDIYFSGSNYTFFKDTVFVNVEDESYAKPIYNGFSIGGLDTNEDSFNVVTRIYLRSALSTAPAGKIGSFLLGRYYDMPHSPDLKLTMTREMDGVKRIRTKGGNDLVDHRYLKPPLWGSLAPWEIGNGGNQALSRVGRRQWDLSWSYLQGSDMFGANQNISEWSDEWTAYRPIYQGGGADWDQYGYEEGDLKINPDGHGIGYNYNLLTDDNFYSQVIHKTNGGQLPFVFQPNKDDNTQFAICKLDMNTFQFKQAANGVYNVKLKIREVW